MRVAGLVDEGQLRGSVGRGLQKNKMGRRSGGKFFYLFFGGVNLNERRVSKNLEREWLAWKSILQAIKNKKYRHLT